MRAYWRQALGAAIAIACLAWLFHNVSIASIAQGFRGLRWPWVAASIGAQLTSYVWQGARWRLLLRPFDGAQGKPCDGAQGKRGHPISWARTTEAIYAGLFLNEIMPARPGEMLRAYLVSRETDTRLRDVLGTVIVERLFDGVWVSVGLLVTVATAPLPRRLVDAGTIFAFVVVAGAIALAFWRGADLRRDAAAFAVSSLFFASQVAAFWCAMRGYGIHRGLLAALGTVVVIQLGTAIPNAPANVGTYQLACVAGLALFGIDTATATGFSVVVFVLLTTPVWLIGGLALARSGTYLKGRNWTMKRYVTVGLFIILALAASFTPARAQETTTGSIAGRVVDQQNLAVPGATVTVISPQGPRTFVTDSDGQFFAPYLPPGTYDVRVELASFKPVDRKQIEVRLGQRVELTIPLELGAVTEAVVVEGRTPLIDTSKTVIGANLDSDLLNTIPVGRRFSDALYIAPGVSSSGQAGNANPAIAGGSGLDNHYVVDDLNVTNTAYGALGSYSIIFGSLGNGVPFDFVEEAQVKTGGYGAEFGEATGGVVNVVTKSGTNQLRGSLFGYTRPDQLESSYKQVETVNGTVNPTGTRSSDVGFQVGGRLIPNKLFFFGALDPQWERTTFVAPDNFPLASLGEVARDRHIETYAAKGTYQPATGHRIDVSFFGDPASGDNGPQRYTALLRTDTAGFSRLDQYGGHNQIVKYEGAMTPRWLIEASVGRAENNIVEVPSIDEWNVTDHTVVPNVHSGGIGFFETGNKGVNVQYQLKATHSLSQHQVRYGLEFDDIDYNNTFDRTGPTFTLPNGAQTATGAEINILADPTFGQVYRVVRANTSAGTDTTQHYLALFAQDTWRVGNRLTVMPGIRYEQQKLHGSLEDLTLDNNWAPRVGATYDFTGQGRGKIFGNWGRFYAKVPNDLAARALGLDAGVSRADYFDAALTQPIPDGVLAANTTSHFLQQGTAADLIDPNVKSTYMDEALAGVEYELVRGLNLGVRYIHRNIGRVIEDVQPFPMVAGDLEIPGASDVNYTLTNPGPNTLVEGDLGASFEKPIHKYDALEVTAEKRLANHWALQSSYRYSRLRGTFEGFYRDDNGQSDPGITSLFDFPTNDPSYTAIGVPQFNYRGDVRYLGALGAGPLPLDRPHQVKVFSAYNFPMGLNVGVGVQLGSGKPLTALAANPVYGSAGEIPEGPRGSGFDTVDGFKTRTPFEYDASLHADYGLRLHGTQKVVLVADVFNLFNTQRALDYDPNTETTFLALNPDLGQPSRFNLAQLQTPRQIRLGVRFDF
jgi:outer membrane receptor protein involved in Fe transport/uncharacterized membrane protein YbhN (UPF0104 family)